MTTNNKKKCKSNAICSVFGCGNRTNVEAKISLHEFPDARKCPNLRKEWIRILKMPTVTASALCCSDHFTPEDFKNYDAKKRRLKNDAKPSQKIPKRTHSPKIGSAKKEKIKQRCERAQRFAAKKLYPTDASSSTSPETGDENANYCLYLHTNKPLSTSNGDTSLSSSDNTLNSTTPSTHNSAPSSSSDNTLNSPTLPTENCMPSCSSDNTSNSPSQGTQNSIHNSPSEFFEQAMAVIDNFVLNSSCNELDTSSQPTLRSVPISLNCSNVLNSNVPMRASKRLKNTGKAHTACVLDLLEKDAQMNACCGVPSFVAFEALVLLCERTLLKLNIPYNLHADFSELIGLCLLKLKHNCSNVLLSAFFHAADRTIGRYLAIGIEILFISLRSIVVWLDKETVMKNMPVAFENFKHTRIVLDCSETKIKKPGCTHCRHQTYSSYKKGHTIKYMVGIAPCGLITYCSDIWGGRTSDKHIFENSTLLDLLEPGDGIMVDKGFMIDDICAEENFVLIRPPFCRNGKLTPEEGVCNVEIAAARVHVERIYQRVKIFDFFKGPISHEMVSCSDQILFIICALVNLQTPIIAEEFLS